MPRFLIDIKAFTTAGNPMNNRRVVEAKTPEEAIKKLVKSSDYTEDDVTKVWQEVQARSRRVRGPLIKPE